MSTMLRNVVDEWPASTLAQRLEDARVILKVQGYLRQSESDRIKNAIKKRWDNELTAAQVKELA